MDARSCTRPDCAPLETIVTFWTEDGERNHFKIFKPMQAIVPDDLPRLGSRILCLPAKAAAAPAAEAAKT
jgi:hypothetical protein